MLRRHVTNTGRAQFPTGAGDELVGARCRVVREFPVQTLPHALIAPLFGPVAGPCARRYSASPAQLRARRHCPLPKTLGRVVLPGLAVPKRLSGKQAWTSPFNWTALGWSFFSPT